MHDLLLKNIITKCRDYAEAVSVFEQECGEHIASARLLEVKTTEVARSKS